MRRGRIRYLGASNWPAERIAAANQYAAAHGLRGFVASQPEWCLAHPNANVRPATLLVHFYDDADARWHAQSQIAAGNPSTITMFGAKDEAEFISHGPWELSPERQPDGRASIEKAQAMIATALREGSHFFEWTHRRPGGGEFPVDVLLTKMERDGNVAIQATVRDITERKRAEAELRRYEMAVEQSSDGIAITDIEGRLTFVNNAWARMHGYETTEMIGQPLSINHTPKQVESEVIPFNDALRKQGKQSGEIGHRRKDGTTFLTWMSGTIFQNDKGEPLGFVGIAHDITERKQAEVKIQQQVDELQRWYSVMIEREGRVQEVKKEVNELLAQLGQPPRYPSASQKEPKP